MIRPTLMEIPKRKTLGKVERLEDDTKLEKVPKSRENVSYLSMPLSEKLYQDQGCVTEESSQQDSESSLDLKENIELREGDSTPGKVETGEEENKSRTKNFCLRVEVNKNRNDEENIVEELYQ